MVTPRPDRFTPEQDTRYPQRRTLGEPPDRSGRVRKISPPPGCPCKGNNTQSTQRQERRIIQVCGSRHKSNQILCDPRFTRRAVRPSSTEVGYSRLAQSLQCPKIKPVCSFQHPSAGFFQTHQGLHLSTDDFVEPDLHLQASGNTETMFHKKKP